MSCLRLNLNVPLVCLALLSLAGSAHAAVARQQDWPAAAPAGTPAAPPVSTEHTAAGGSSASPANRPHTLPLPPPGSRRLASTNRSPEQPNQPPVRTATPNWVTVATSLSLVVGLFLIAAWALKRTLPRPRHTLPRDVLEILGRAPLPGRQQSLELIRCGRKLVLIAISPAGAEPITEITDADEVERLSGLCLQSGSHSATRAFQQTLRELGQQPHSPGFLETPATSLSKRSLRGLAARREELADV